MAGLIIIPACFAYGIPADQAGPSLIFETLPNIFNNMAGGRLWGSLFFLFMIFAAMSTIIAVFENIISCCMDMFGWSRKKASVINLVLVAVLSMPCVLGFNVLAGFTPLGAGSNILDLEDFIISNNILPLGSIVYVLFCTTKKGWGWQNFLAEADTGEGVKFPKWAYGYMKYVMPLLIVVVLVMGWIPVVTTWMGA
jgi:NSS family neurotransmitter:Na+ symporter